MPMDGHLALRFERRDGATVLAHHQHRAPYQVQRPYYPEGRGTCHVVALHNGGGVVGGDRLTMTLELAEGAHGVVTTASAGKIYRSLGPEAVQTVEAAVGAGACLEWLPQETILFDDAIYRQSLRVDLAADARLLAWEVTRFGRTARGERFERGRWRSHIEVHQAGRPLWIDRQAFEPDEAAWESPQGLGGKPVLGSLVWLGGELQTGLEARLRELADGLTGEAGVSRLPCGLSCRYRGEAGDEAIRWFTAVRRALREAHGQSSANLLRL